METGEHAWPLLQKKESFDTKVRRVQKILTEEDIRLAIEAIQAYDNLHAILHLKNAPHEWPFDKAVAAIRTAKDRLSGV